MTDYTKIPRYDIVVSSSGLYEGLTASKYPGLGYMAERDVDAAIAALTAERDAAMSVLAGLSSYLGAGLGDENTTAEQYDKRIRWGIDNTVANLTAPKG